MERTARPWRAPDAVLGSRRHDLVQRLRRLAKGRSARDQALLLDGTHLVQAALDVRWPLELLALGASASRTTEGAALVNVAAARGVPIVQVTDGVMDGISPVRSPSGIVALARPRNAGIDDLLDPAPALVVVAVDVQDPGNVGAILRCADAFGATGVVCAGATADPFGWKALRGSMGSALRLPVLRATDPVATVRDLRRHGVRTLAAIARAPRADDAGWRPPTALLLGSEGAGLPTALLDLADGAVSVPMRAGVESLNVAVATGVLLYEAARQRADGARS